MNGHCANGTICELPVKSPLVVFASCSQQAEVCFHGLKECGWCRNNFMCTDIWWKLAELKILKKILTSKSFSWPYLTIWVETNIPDTTEKMSGWGLENKQIYVPIWYHVIKVVESRWKCFFLYEMQSFYRLRKFQASGSVLGRGKWYWNVSTRQICRQRRFLVEDSRTPQKHIGTTEAFQFHTIREGSRWQV